MVEGKDSEKKLVEEPAEEEEKTELGVYPRRWVILFISCTAIFLRGFNQSCYGPINSVFVKFLQIQPWQVDWFILTQSVVFLSMALPLSWFTSRIGFKNSYIVMCATLAVGFGLTCVGCSLRTGFPSAIVGQCIMGFSNIISWSIPPPTAAIWFPTREVATAVALQVVGRGVGESLGSILTPLTVNPRMADDEIGFRLMWIFITMTAIAVLLTLGAIFFVVDAPPLPPSESRAKAIREKKKAGNLEQQSFREALTQYKGIIKELFVDPYFICIWIVFGVANPVLRNNSVLLSSVLHSAFSEDKFLNKKAGYVLMGGWIGYTIGGFIAGPLITKTKKYRYMVLFSVGFECLAAMVVMIGMKIRELLAVYVGVVSTGLFLGMANTSLFEIVLEVTYPKPPMLVTMINIIGMGICRLIYPIIGRYLLMYVGATASCAFPFAMLLAATIVMMIVKTPTKRLDAEMSETKKLLDKENNAN